MTDDHGCRDVLLNALRQDPEGTLDVTISTAPPLIAGPYTTAPFTCPHGVSYWLEPTGEQIARWAEDGTR